MIERVLEPELMDTAQDAAEYDSMDHSAVNRQFVLDLLAVLGKPPTYALDVATGTAQIPIELAKAEPAVRQVALDAAGEMILLAEKNVREAGQVDRIVVAIGNARELPFPDGTFDLVYSNSLVHHLADPGPAMAEMVRVCQPGGQLFLRDLCRPDTEEVLQRQVETYAAGATDYQRRLFADSLRAALTLEEVRAEVRELGIEPDQVQMSSDRHWTWHGQKPTSG